MSIIQQIVDSRLTRLEISPDIDNNIIEDFDVDWKELSSCKVLQVKDSFIFSLEGIQKLQQLHTIEIIYSFYEPPSSFDLDCLSKLKKLEKLNIEIRGGNIESSDTESDDEDDDKTDEIYIRNIENLKMLAIESHLLDINLENLPNLVSLSIGVQFQTLNISNSITQNIRYLEINVTRNNTKIDPIPFFPNLEELMLHCSVNEYENRDNYLISYNLYKIEILHVCGYQEDTIDNYRFENYQRRMLGEMKNMNLYFLSSKISNLWDRFLNSQDKDNLNRLSYLVF